MRCIMRIPECISGPGPWHSLTTRAVRSSRLDAWQLDLQCHSADWCRAPHLHHRRLTVRVRVIESPPPCYTITSNELDNIENKLIPPCIWPLWPTSKLLFRCSWSQRKLHRSTTTVRLFYFSLDATAEKFQRQLGRRRWLLLPKLLCSLICSSAERRQATFRKNQSVCAIGFSELSFTSLQCPVVVVPRLFLISAWISSAELFILSRWRNDVFFTFSKLIQKSFR